jgi:hypothetical protein
VTDQTLEQKAVELITNMEKLAEPAMQLTLQAIQLASVINAVLCVTFLVSAFFSCRFAAKRILPLYQETESELIEFAGGSLLALLVCAAGAITILSMICIIELFSASTWLAIFAPELRLAQMLIEKIV